MSKVKTADEVLDAIREHTFLSVPPRTHATTAGLGIEALDPTTITEEERANMSAQLMQGLYEFDPRINPPEPEWTFNTLDVTPTLGLSRKDRVILWKARHSVTAMIKSDWGEDYYLRFENMIMPAEDHLYKVRNTDEDRAYCKLATEVLVMPHEDWARQFSNAAPEVTYAGSPAYLSKFSDKCLTRTFARLVWNDGQPVAVEVLDGTKLWRADLTPKNNFRGENSPTHDGAFTAVA